MPLGSTIGSVTQAILDDGRWEPEAAATCLIISGGDGTANWPYFVLMSTNLPANWTPVATNSFDASGIFSITLTNAISAGLGQSFYRLQLQ
jgi:hypothetical protein